MRLFLTRILLICISAFLLTACARDLSSKMYLSDSTLSLTMEGQVVSVRPVIIKETDKLEENTLGLAGGGISGGLLGSIVATGTDSIGSTLVSTVAPTILGAVIGSIIESKLNESRSSEYVIKVDTDKLNGDSYTGSGAMRSAVSSATTGGLITVIQKSESPIKEGQKVYVIFSEKRTRIIPA